VAREIVKRFSNVTRVGITLRESISATHNNWGAMLYVADSDSAFFAPLSDGTYSPYHITGIVDRVGAGDSFGAGLIHCLRSSDYSDSADAVAFATAASCLTHSISGDFNYSTRGEIEALMKGSGSGRVVR
jgi:2-dehydro-3-deoxygluconokinase